MAGGGFMEGRTLAWLNFTGIKIVLGFPAK
jgi:hypothetical protein